MAAVAALGSSSITLATTRACPRSHRRNLLLLVVQVAKRKAPPTRVPKRCGYHISPTTLPLSIRTTASSVPDRAARSIGRSRRCSRCSRAPRFPRRTAWNDPANCWRTRSKRVVPIDRMLRTVPRVPMVSKRSSAGSGWRWTQPSSRWFPFCSIPRAICSSCTSFAIGAASLPTQQLLRHRRRATVEETVEETAAVAMGMASSGAAATSIGADAIDPIITTAAAAVAMDMATPPTKPPLARASIRSPSDSRRVSPRSSGGTSIR
mmetsp:Transcript_8333/g.23281  ORF Transcript_8333/g.23281 Transcript_8333/m.23281 type:complete len:264 (-) Transcript_8333:244-1035(-)